ncbi:MAG: DUF2878 domain-containing protein [Phycisphaerales bacterium]|nr:MAG: DUF2878 domain-containing protein [Phycisphaerales bacterium]
MVRWKRLLNLISFQTGWFACALGAAGGWSFAGPVAVAVLLCLQLLLVPAPGRYARFILVAALLGWIVDSALYRAGVFSFPEAGFVYWLCPIWMVALWANFAGTLHFCLDWLRGHYWLASVLGAIGGPLAYYGGHRLGALQLGGSIPITLAIIAIEYAVVTPSFVFLSERPGLDGLRPATAESQVLAP